MKPETLEKLRARLEFYDDLRLLPFYRDRAPYSVGPASSAPIRRGEAGDSTRVRKPELNWPASVRSPASGGLPPASGEIKQTPTPGYSSLPPAAPEPKTATTFPQLEPLLFDVVERVEGDTLERIRADIGDCTRCKLCRKRTNIVFGVGSPRAELVFVGEAPGAEEDAQGLPFVGRAGQLLTQMVEAMGLKRSDVYICNVVKCRPPENRSPEKDEIATCSPFLFRQLDVLRPKAIVALGAVALQTLLGGHISITKVRGQWLEFKGMRLMPTYHPAYLLRNPNAKPEAWADLQKVMGLLGLQPRGKGRGRVDSE